jgi:hypothetical protein
MRLLTRRKTPTEELKDAAIQALLNALDDDERAAKPRTTGVRALAAGALIYTAGRAAFKSRRFVREQLSSDAGDDQAEDVEDEEETLAYEEPDAEEHEVDEEEDEPEVQRAARRKGAQPSLKLPKQRRARTWVSTRA